MIHAWLGDIPLEIPAWALAQESRIGHDFAEHQPIGTPPRLQSVGRGLEEIRLAARIAAEPRAALARLRAALEEAEVLPLVFADGTFPGRYVLTELTERRILGVAGGPYLADVDLTLREYVVTDPVALAELAQIQQAPGLQPQPPAGVTQ